MPDRGIASALPAPWSGPVGKENAATAAPTQSLPRPDHRSLSRQIRAKEAVRFLLLHRHSPAPESGRTIGGEPCQGTVLA